MERTQHDGMALDRSAPAAAVPIRRHARADVASKGAGRHPRHPQDVLRLRRRLHRRRSRLDHRAHERGRRRRRGDAVRLSPADAGRCAAALNYALAHRAEIDADIAWDKASG